MRLKKIITSILACSLALCSMIGTSITADAASISTEHGIRCNNEYIANMGGPVIGTKYVYEKGTDLKKLINNAPTGGPGKYVYKSKTTNKTTGVTTITAEYKSVGQKSSTTKIDVQLGITRHFGIGVYSHAAAARTITAQIMTWDIGGTNAITTKNVKLERIQDASPFGGSKRIYVYRGDVKIKVRNVNGKTTTITVPLTYSEEYNKNVKTIGLIGTGLNTDVVIGTSAMSLKNGLSTKLPAVGDNINRYIMING